ncbi:Creatinase/aminopeptidase [Hesseltinella vesiculosa]|uniref:Creatinase/aminopeptidase n=1 Tax=Hesseltinella vesiculosa TaxID=101127 RepID=A0A1X2GF69_9FUNG|nr:Creatinase/aminopeptidase [Hesseltinella vesiculosa]
MDEYESMWKSPPGSPSQLIDRYDVDQVHEENDLHTILDALHPSTIYTLDITDTSMLPKHHHPSLNKTHLRPVMDECRLIKHPWEIKLLRQVCHASSKAHISLMQSTRKHRHEHKLRALFRCFIVLHGLSREAYIPIVLSGRRAAILHETLHHEPLPNDEHTIVLVDAGGERSCYGTDITRCYPANGKFSPEARTIYEIVLRMQETVLSHLKEGVMWADMEFLAKRVLCEELIRIGILQGDVDELMYLGVVHAFYFHSLGHSVGLDVHDVGGRHRFVHDDHEERSEFLCNRPLEANMVVTVEPGLYFNEVAMRPWLQAPGYDACFDIDKINQYSAVGGIRIEDTVVITKQGVDNLTIVPKSVDAIERLMEADSVVDLYPPLF